MLTEGAETHNRLDNISANHIILQGKTASIIGKQVTFQASNVPQDAWET